MESHIGRCIPPYAILSHTWEDGEVTLQDWSSPTRDSMKGFHKIRMICRLAASQGIKYAWSDTCCIDKSNSAELSEAINSMYRWYQGAQVCYAYLSDLILPAQAASGDTANVAKFLRGCRWFSRGWTLQELIAPADVLFYQHDWCHVGSKTEWREALSEVAGIDSEALEDYDPKRYSIAERMSWAAGRETTREEDKAYCLLGIFDINMPMLYGEGEKAFRRLQEEIIRTGYDVSIFAWTRPVPGNLRSWRQGNLRCGAFANVLGDFYSMPVMDLVESQGNEISITNVGVKLTLELCLVWIAQTGKLSYVLPIRRRRRTEKGQFESALGVALERWSAGRFARTNVDQLVVIPDDEQAGTVHRIRCPGAYVMTEIPRTGPKTGHPFNFVFHQGCRVVKAWPSDKWDDVKNSFVMSFDGEECGSLLVEVNIPTLAGNDDGRSGEFMFLFGSRHFDGIPQNPQDLQYTTVGYREHQLILDIINMRMENGDIDVQEMRRTLMNFAIPRQRTAGVPANASGQYIYASVASSSTAYYEGEKVWGNFSIRQFLECVPRRPEKFVVTGSPFALENEQQPWTV